MIILLNLFFILLGSLILWKGADTLVESAVSISRKLGISPFLVGVTIVAFGTSLPEAMASINAHLILGKTSLAVANILGSNITNITLVLGPCALLCAIPLNKNLLKFDFPALLFFNALLAYFLMSSEMSFNLGLIFLASYVFFIVYKSLKEKNSSQEAQEDSLFSWPKETGLLILSLVLLPLGTHFLVKGGVGIGQSLSLSDRFIGLTFVALGTSGPELATSLVAAAKKETDLAIANILGSNILNITLLGLLGVLNPFKAAFSYFQSDLYLNLFLTLFLIAIVIFCKKIHKLLGLCFLLIYLSFILFNMIY